MGSPVLHHPLRIRSSSSQNIAHYQHQRLGTFGCLSRIQVMKVDNELGARLLREWYGQNGYKALHQSTKENLEGI